MSLRKVRQAASKVTDCGVTAKDNRLFIEAVLWIVRTGAPWRDLPECFGRWHTVYMRDNRGSKKGGWQRIAGTLADDPDLEPLMMDGSIVRVHQHGVIKATMRPAERRHPSGVRRARDSPEEEPRGCH